MVNLGGGPAFILGLFLAIAGAGLFFLRSVRPELARDYDIFFAAVGLLCGVILIFNGWRLDPILQFSQFLLAGTAAFFAFESVRMRGVATEQARRNTATVDRDRPVSRTRVYTEAELDKIDPYDNVYEGAQPNYSSPRLRGYDDPQPRSNRRTSRTRSAPPEDFRDEPRRRPTRNRPDRDSVVREPQGDYTTDTPRDRETYGDRYGYEEPNSRSSRPRRPAAPARDAYDEWDDVPKSASRPRRPATPAVDSYDQRNNNSVREDRYSPSTEPRRRANPADLGRSYEPEEDYPGDDLGSSYDDSGSGRSYDDEKPIPGDYVVDYQPLEDVGTDYSDDNYDDEGNNYDDYDEPEGNSEQNDYDDYNDQPQRRTPINFNNDYD